MGEGPISGKLSSGSLQSSVSVNTHNETRLRLGSTFPFATLELRRELEPKCVLQLFLGTLLGMCRSAIGQLFFP